MSKSELRLTAYGDDTKFTTGRSMTPFQNNITGVYQKFYTNSQTMDFGVGKVKSQKLFGRISNGDFETDVGEIGRIFLHGRKLGFPRITAPSLTKRRSSDIIRPQHTYIIYD